MALGSLVVRLGLDAAEFSRGMSKAEYQAKQFVENTQATVTRLAGVFTLVTGAAAGALAVMNKAADAVAVYKGLSEEIGATAAAVAGLQTASDLSGVALETVAASSVRLTANLSKSGQTATDTAAALKAINIPVEEFKKLDPVSQLERVAKQLASFEDGAGKTAVAVQLFGKAGAELIPFFNDLADAGGRQVRLTEEQIEAADRYTKEFARLKSELSAAAQVIIAESIPAFTGLLTGVRDLIRDTNVLGNNTAVRDFAFGAAKALAVLIESAVVVAKGIRALVGSFEAVFADIQLVSEFFGRGAFGGLLFEKNRKALAEALEKRNKTVEEANARYVDLWNFDSTAISRAIEAAQNSISTDAPATKRPTLSFTLPEGGGKKDSEAERYLKALERTYEAAQELTHYEQLMWDVEQGRLGAVTPKQLEYAVSITKALDAQKAAAIEAEKRAAMDELIAAAQQRDADAQERMTQSLKDQASAWLDTIDPMRAYLANAAKINQLVAGGFLSDDQAEAIKKKLQDTTKSLDDNQYAINAARGIQSAFSDFLFDPFKDGLDGMLENFGRVIQRMLAEALALKAIEGLFGKDFTKTGQIGGFLGSLFNGGGGFGTGSNFGNQDYGAYLATGTNYVPYDGFKAVLHQGEAVVPKEFNPAAGGVGGGINQYITIQGTPQSAPERDELRRTLSRAMRQNLADARMRGAAV